MALYLCIFFGPLKWGATLHAPITPLRLQQHKSTYSDLSLSEPLHWFSSSVGFIKAKETTSEDHMPQAASHILKVFGQIDRNADINEKRLWNNENVMTVTMLGKQYHVIKASWEIIVIAFYASVKNWHVPSLQSIVLNAAAF